MCVCVPMPTHCTITCFGFHARRINGVKCDLFSNHAPLGQTTLCLGEYLYRVLEKVEVRVTVSVTVCVMLLCCVGLWRKEERRWNPVPAHSLFFSKSTKGASRLNVPIRRTNRYQQYYMPSQHIYCGRAWNLTKTVMYNLVIRKCTSPLHLAPRLKIFKWKFTTQPGIEPRTCWTRGRHATIWANAASYYEE